MKLEFKVADESVCVIDVWEDKVPNIAQKLRETLPLTSVLQHGKIVGDLVFFVTPIVADWENSMLTEKVGVMRREEGKEAKGAVCFYGPRQQFAIAYGNDLADEPLRISYIGEVLEGHLKLELIGTQCWLQQGKKVELAVLDD
jgi:hypothetical protein